MFLHSFPARPASPCPGRALSGARSGGSESQPMGGLRGLQKSFFTRSHADRHHLLSPSLLEFHSRLHRSIQPVLSEPLGCWAILSRWSGSPPTASYTAVGSQETWFQTLSLSFLCSPVGVIAPSFPNLSLSKLLPSAGMVHYFLPSPTR